VGGSGSGRWGWHSKKTTVDECLPLDAAKLAREGMIQPSPGAGSLVWRNVATGEQTASAAYRRELVGDGLVFRLVYTVTRRDGERHDVDEPIALQTTHSSVGGMRWWFTCPLVTNGGSCGRRVGKLYLPPGARYFGCRHCYDLTYESSQESHKYDRLFAELARGTGLDPTFVKRALSS
jgi:hypothetical protein